MEYIGLLPLNDCFDYGFYFFVYSFKDYYFNLEAGFR